LTTKKAKKNKRFRKPKQIAAIDIGSTSARLCVAEMSLDGKMTVLEELVHPVAVGRDTFNRGYITPEVLRALCSIMCKFSGVIKTYQAEELAVATSAMREAENCDLVVDRIRHESGINISVIDAVEESRLTCQVLLPFLELNLSEANGYTLFVDLGGGSTETLLLKGEDIVLANNRRLGTLRLFQNLTRYGDRQMLQESVIRNVVSSTLNHFRDYTISNCVISNSLVEKVLADIDGVEAIEGGLKVPMEAFASVISMVERKSNNEDIALMFGFTQAEVELFMPALATLERLFKTIKPKCFYIAELELMTSVLYDLRMRAWGQNPLLEFSEQVIQSARGLAARFGYDESHSIAVAQMSVALYDYLADYLDLSGKDRLYLEVAGILHDVGMFISDEAHHKHSQYLIEWSEIVGLNREERSLVAMIARYHRKALPNLTHQDFARLPLSDRLRVSKLAAILRVADALDRPHLQVIRNLKADINEKSILITIDGKTDLIVERVAMRSKGSLLCEITGLDIELARKQ